ncbi:MAG: serine/threonine protein kinase [Myxococcales bacterium]|nr:serine/threonine protein kinase [Myxococcales bacterium]
MTCPDDETFAAFAEGSLAEPLRAQIADHAGSCETCHAVISDLVGDITAADSALAETSSSWTSLPVASADPTKIERYEVVRRLGAGAMGVVFEAHDPELDRALAIKLLRPGASADRLRREAQALAKLTHPNVVGVYDVGPYGDGAFVAMELVDGMTLRAWLRAPRTTAQILDVIVQTARGVEAAHREGIVHRDLKPDNIFVSHDDEVRVGDFGLARSDGAPQSEGGGGGVTGAVELTHTGTMLGTPAYMAPEQAYGEAIAASDQFSLCVTAWEALYGQRPFTGRTVDELIEAARTGKLVEPTSKRRVPRRIQRALRRGLAGEPEARHPSVAALIAALSPRATRWPMFAAGGVVLCVAAAVGTIDGARQPDPCSDAGSLAIVWSPVRRLQLQAALGKVPGGAAAFVITALHDIDAYVRDWSELRHQTCVATHVRHERTPDVAAQIGLCLDRGATIARRLIDSVELDHTIDAAKLLTQLEGLAPVEHCLSTTAVTHPTPLLAELQTKLADLDLQQRTINAPLVGVDLQLLIKSARAIGEAALTSETLNLVGSTELVRGESTAAERDLHEALLLADAARDDRLRARAAARLVDLLVRTGRVREAIAQRDVAVSARDRAGGDPLTDVLVERGTALIARASSDAAAEIRAFRRILEIQVTAHGSVSFAAIGALEDLAYALERSGNPEFQTVLDQEGSAIRALMVASGETEDATQMASGNAMLRGDYVTAVRDAEAAVTMAMRSPDAGTPSLISDLAMTYEAAGNFVEAHRAYGDAARMIDGLPEESRNIPLLVDALEGEGRSGLESIEMSDDSDTAKANLATTSLAVTDRGLVLAKQIGESYKPSVDALEGQRGRALVALARWKEALPVLRAALDRTELEQPRRPFSVAMRSFMLARTLWAIGDDKDRDHARVLAKEAAEAFVEARAQFASRATLVTMVQILDRRAAALRAWRDTHR